MLIRLFYILLFVVILFGVSGYILNSSDAGPHDLYKGLIGGQGIVTADSDAKKLVKSNRHQTQDYFSKIRIQQDRLRNQMRDLKAKLLGNRQADKVRRQDADARLSNLNQKNDDSIRRQQDRLRDLQKMSRDRMSLSRNQR